MTSVDVELSEVVTAAKQHLYSKGMIWKATDADDQDDILHVPISLLPAPFPAPHYTHALHIQPHLNLLYHCVASDKAFLHECLKDVMKGDDFIRNIWNIYDETTDRRGFSNKIVLALNRSDYMLDEMKQNGTHTNEKTHIQTTTPHTTKQQDTHIQTTTPHTTKQQDTHIQTTTPHTTKQQDTHTHKLHNGTNRTTGRQLNNNINSHTCNEPPCGLKQVEFNTISCGGASTSALISHYHQYITRKYPQFGIDPSKIVSSRGKGVLVESMLEAWKLYGNPDALIVVLSNLNDHCTSDVTSFEKALYKVNKEVKMVRKSFHCLKIHASLRGDGALLLDGEEVAIVYYRWGYTPEHYESEADWTTRLMIEKSRAIVCPNAGYQLAGCKKIQQVLVLPGVLEKYLKDQEVVREVRSTFAGIYCLDLNDEGNRHSDMAQADPGAYVLKPQREGGGNNLYQAEMKSKLQELEGKAERAKYILMDKLRPRPFLGYPIKPRKGCHVTEVKLVSELGIYGGLIGKGEDILLNRSGGALVRSKAWGCEEGSFSLGLSVADSVYLVD